MWLDLIVDCFKMLKSHCFAHKLALVCQHSSEDVAWLQIFERTMLRLWVYFSKSSVRTAELEAVLKRIGLNNVTILKAAFTRWLSHHSAVTNMRAALAAVVRQMKDSVDRLSGEKKAEVRGTLKTVRSFRFFATVYFFCDALQPANLLSRKLQARGLTFSTVEAAYATAKSRLQSMLDEMNEKTCPSYMTFIGEIRDGKIDGEYIRELEVPGPDLASTVALHMLDFQDKVAKPFLRALLQRLKARFEDNAHVCLLAAMERVILPPEISIDLPKAYEGHVRAQAQQKESAHKQFDVPPMQSAHLLRLKEDVATVCQGLGLGEDKAGILEAEHHTWRSQFLTVQLRLLKGASKPITSTSDLSCAFTAESDGPTETHRWLPLLEDNCPQTLSLLAVCVSAALTSVEAERGFSKMKLTLTRLRSQLKEKQLNNLMFVEHHAPRKKEDVEKLLDEAVRIFRDLKPRRMDSAKYNDDPKKKTIIQPKRKPKQSKMSSFFGIQSGRRLRMPDAEQAIVTDAGHCSARRAL
jgi:hypothetical protein